MGGKELWNKVNEKVTKVQSESETGRENRVTNVRQIVTLLASNMADCKYTELKTILLFGAFYCARNKNFYKRLQ